MSIRFYDDIAPGETVRSGEIAVSRDDIIAFGRAFDPQPFHLDEAAGQASGLGGLIASGWHSCALLMRLSVDSFLGHCASMGAPGVEEVRWLKPVRPGDRLHAVLDVDGRRDSRSRRDRGFLHIASQLVNGAGDTVLTQTCWLILARQSAAGAPPLPLPLAGPAAVAPVVTAAVLPQVAVAPAVPPPFLADLAIGAGRELGRVSLDAEAIIAFARAFDPQLFHTDPEAARRSHFGALCASGWHTAAVWMRLLADYRRGSLEAARAQGVVAPRFGPSPGIRDLKWLKPVYAGDTLTCRTELVEKRASASRPGWGIAVHRNRADNQNGEPVLEFLGTGLWEWAPPASRA